MGDFIVKTKDMTQGNELKHIVLFSLPLMLGNIFQQLYIVCDTMIVSRFVGLQAMAAIGCADWLTWMGLSIVTGLAQGFSIPVSHAFGTHDKRNVQDNISSAFVCAIVSVCVVIGLLYFSCGTILKILDTPSAIYSMSVEYTKIIAVGLVATMFYNVLASILRALGNSKIPLMAMIVASLSNVVLDLWFILGFGWGLKGAAVATVLAQGLAGLVCFFFLVRMKDFMPYVIKTNASLMANQMKLAIPMAIQNVWISVGGMVLTRAVNQYGTYFLAGFTAMNKLYGVIEISAISYGYAMVTYTSQNNGAKTYKRIQSGVKKMIGLSLVTAFGLSALILLFSHTLLSFFIDVNEKGGMMAMEYGTHFLRMIVVWMPVLYLLHMYRSTIQGLNDALIPMLSGVLELLMRISGALILPVFFGKEGLYVVEIMAWFGALFILIPAYYIHQRAFLFRK